jgi:predicted PurR-regulated permease PerM
VRVPEYPRLRPPTYRSLILIGALVGLAVLMYAAGAALTPYLIGLILVFVLNPVVDRLQAWGLRRGLATIIVIVALIVGLALGIWLVLGVVIDQARALIASWPELSANLIDIVEDSGLSPSIAQSLIEVIEGLPVFVADIAPQLAGTLVAVIGSGIVAIVSLAALPFFIYYVIADRPGLIQGAYRLVPEEYVTPARDIASIANGVFGAWAWGQLLLSTSVAVPVFLGFMLLGIFVDPFYSDYALLFASIAFFTEFIPIVGAYLAMIPAIIITLAAVGPLGALATAVLFMAVQFFEGSVLIPRIQGSALSLPAAVVLLALVIGVALGGFLGVLVALPLTATMRAVIQYLYQRSAGVPSAAALAIATSPGRHRSPADVPADVPASEPVR